MFMIHHKAAHEILFAGIFREPKQSWICILNWTQCKKVFIAYFIIAKNKYFQVVGFQKLFSSAFHLQLEQKFTRIRGRSTQNVFECLQLRSSEFSKAILNHWPKYFFYLRCFVPTFSWINRTDWNEFFRQPMNSNKISTSIYPDRHVSNPNDFSPNIRIF